MNNRSAVTEFIEHTAFPEDHQNWGKETQVTDRFIHRDYRPMAVFHGTCHEKPYFGVGTHFGLYPAAQSRLASFVTRDEYAEQQPYIYKAYISITNPYRLDDCWHDKPIGFGKRRLFQETPVLSSREKYHVLEPTIQYTSKEYKMSDAHTLRECASYNFFPQSHKDHIFLREHLTTFRFFNILQQKGYDGLVYKNHEESGGSDSWVIFHPEQCVLDKRRLSFKNNYEIDYDDESDDENRFIDDLPNHLSFMTEKKIIPSIPPKEHNIIDRFKDFIFEAKQLIDPPHKKYIHSQSRLLNESSGRPWLKKPDFWG